MIRYARFLFAGLETGTSGALAMLAWLGFSSILARHSAWWVPNLFAGHVTNRLGWDTLTGAALTFTVYGSLGMLYGFLWRNRAGGGTSVLAAVTFAIAAYFLVVRGVWHSVSPLPAVYSPDRQILIGHLLYGLCLTRFPRVLALHAAAVAPQIDV